MNPDPLPETPDASPSPATELAEAVMCDCSGTTRGQIECLAAQGLDLDAISRKTGALTGCGGCEWDIADLVQQLEARRAG